MDPRTQRKHGPVDALVFGVAIGAALAVALDDIAVGIAVGVLFAFALGHRGRSGRA